MHCKKTGLFICALLALIVLGACGNGDANTESGAVQEQDIPRGTWYVGAIYYKNMLFDIRDVDELENIYGSTYLTLNEDGTFSYHNIIYTSKGECTKYEQAASDSYLLKTTSVSSIEIENGNIAEKEVISDLQYSTYIITFLDDKSTISFSTYDPVTGKAKVDESPIIYVKDDSWEYVEQNKTEINN